VSVPPYSNPLGISAERTKVIACATVIEEMQALLPPAMPRQVLDFGLHLHPKTLAQALQDAVDQSQAADLILLGYGQCSQAVIGLKSGRCTLVVPRVDDCIAIFLGSRTAYLNQANREPGTYYLTKGWIEVGDSPFEEFERLVKKYGEKKAKLMMELMFKNYTRLAFINTGDFDLERFRDYTRRAAERFGLRYEEIDGTPSLVHKLIFGPWDDEIVVCPPGETITYGHFMTV